MNKNLLGGILFTCLIAFLGILLAQLPVLRHIGPLAVAIIIAVVYRQLFGFPVHMQEGIQFASKKLLRVAIILFGLKLPLDVVFQEGLGLLARSAFTILFAVSLTMLFAKWWKANWTMSMLLAVGTGVCGAAAIAAVSPILKANEEDTALSVGIIALVGTIFGIGYTILLPVLPIDSVTYGYWSGLSLHEIAHVALAAAPAGEEALGMALLAKLTRVLLLIPLCFILVAWMRRKNGNAEEKAHVEFPWFLLGFIVMSFIGSYVLGKRVDVPQQALDAISFLTTFLLAMAMSGLGLNVDMNKIGSKTTRPLLAMLLTSVMLSIVTLWML
ncbi:YeiH family protein [Pontibacillus litoralis]|uniref:YeiH family protein n=1 Tax=Pontibacillus litoralis TaxID=516703 RepID=UPI000569555E|nr:putative sulfate exporter family transporter [Pontibacillus litoralis]